jgi:hypothetical protein
VELRSPIGLRTIVRSPLQRHSMPSCSNEVRCSGILCRRAATKSAAATWNVVVRSPRCRAAATWNVVVQQRSPLQRHSMPSCSNEVRAAEQQRHRVPWYEVRSSGIECRCTKSEGSLAAIVGSGICFEIGCNFVLRA